MKFLFLLLVAPFVSGDKIITTSNGPIKGTTLVRTKNIEAFLGIPFAEPPVGPLRFAKPVAKSSWEDTYDADKLPPACVQATLGLLAVDPEKMSEDCLYLNLWVPQSGSEPKTIMVYIHGGAFMIGSSNIRLYDGATLAERGDVIVATINYRVGTLGFFSGFINEAAGNMGIYDQLMAIRWIKENAKHFGGDPENIVLFGQSSGAFSVSLHMVSPLSKNYFRRAILQSGSAFHPMYSDKNEILFMGSQAIATMLGCADAERSLKTNPKDVVECMKNLPAKTFSDTDLMYFRKYGILIPRVGDELLPETPIQLFRKGEFKDTELLLGINRDEGPSFLALQRPNIFGPLGEKVDASTFNEATAREIMKSMAIFVDGDIIQNYLDRVKHESRYTYLTAMGEFLGDFLITCGSIYQADYHSLRDNQVYFYLYEFKSPSSPRAEWMGVTHFEEVPYVFGNPLHKNFTEHERELSNDVIDMWITFAKTGNPNLPSGLKWPRYTYADPKYFIIGQRDRIGVRPDNHRCEKWRNLFRSAVSDDVIRNLKNPSTA